MNDLISYANRRGELLFGNHLPKYYQMVETSIITSGLEFIVLHKIKLPTLKESGKLYHVLPVPIVTEGKTITISIQDQNHLAIKRNGEHMSLSDGQLSNCHKFPEIITCRNMPWISPEFNTCVASIFHGSDEKQISQHCNFKVDQDMKTTPPVYLGKNKWHFALLSKTKAVVSCQETTYVQEIYDNGWITIDKDCIVRLDKYVLKANEINQNNRSMEIKIHNNLLDYQLISKIKLGRSSIKKKLKFVFRLKFFRHPLSPLKFRPKMGLNFSVTRLSSSTKMKD